VSPAELLEFFRAHHAEIVYSAGLALAALNVAITFALRFAPLTTWVTIAEKSPRVAALVRLMGALGIQPVPVLQALIDLIRGNASPGTLASAKTLDVSSSKPLIAPPALPKGPAT
jgi:hypothetical protein